MKLTLRWKFDWPVGMTLLWSMLLLGLALHGYWFPRAHSLFDIYALASQRWWNAHDLYCIGRDWYRYSPLFAISFTPLGLLPERVGTALWKLINGSAYAYAVAAWARRGLPVALTEGQQGALSLIAIPLAMHSLHNGQANLLMMAAVLMAFVAIAENCWNRSAAFLAVATLIKGYPGVLGLALGCLYPRKFAGRYAVALGLGLIFPFTTQPIHVVQEQYLSWFNHLRESEHIMRGRLRSLNYLLEVYHYPISPTAFDMMEILAAASMLGLAYHQARRTPNRKEVLAWTALWFFIWVVLFGPATESCTYVAMGPAVAYLMVELSARRASFFSRATICGSALLMGPLICDLFPVTLHHWLTRWGAQPIGAIGIAAYLAARAGTPLFQAQLALRGAAND
jgi:hypothetical protein